MVLRTLLNRDVAFALFWIFVLVVPRNVLRIIYVGIVGPSGNPEALVPMTAWGAGLVALHYVAAVLVSATLRMSETFRGLRLLERSLVVAGVVLGLGVVGGAVAI